MYALHKLLPLQLLPNDALLHKTDLVKSMFSLVAPHDIVVVPSDFSGSFLLKLFLLGHPDKYLYVKSCVYCM